MDATGVMKDHYFSSPLKQEVLEKRKKFDLGCEMEGLEAPLSHHTSNTATIPPPIASSPLSKRSFVPHTVSGAASPSPLPLAPRDTVTRPVEGSMGSLQAGKAMKKAVEKRRIALRRL